MCIFMHGLASWTLVCYVRVFVSYVCVCVNVFVACTVGIIPRKKFADAMRKADPVWCVLLLHLLRVES